ncbi:hypothetical protein GCM10027284_41820 [Cyclobacterium sediminis]
MLVIQLFLVLFSFELEAHPFYISLTDMVYNNERQRIEIAQKIFWNDMEVALSNASGHQVNFLRPEKPEELEKIIETYILLHNKVEVNGEVVKLSYLGHEIEEDAAWFYLESEELKAPHEVTIFNSLLVEDFPTQQNIINFYKNRKPKSLITRKDKTSGVLELD